MAEVQLKNDFDTFSRQLQHQFEAFARIFMRFVLRYVPPSLKAAVSSFYKKHLEGVTAVQLDGPTKETERMSNLSYEEVIDTLEKCQRDGIKAFSYEFKKGYAVDDDGNKIINDDLGKNQSISKMEEITKANRQITKYTQRQVRHPNILKNYNTRKLHQWQEKREKAIEKHEGYRYNIVFNKSRIGYMGDRLADIKSKRLGITKDEFFVEHPEAKEAVERAIDEGLDLNLEELGTWAKEFVNEGDSDISNFQDDYFIHTISLQQHTEIYNELNEKSIPYGVELNKSNNKNNDTVKLYIHSKDFDEYQKIGALNNGVLQSFGKKDTTTKIYNITRKEEKETKDIVLSRSSLNHYIDMFKGKDFTINLNGRNEKTFIVRMTLDDAKEVLAYEKKRNKVQEKLDEIRHEQEEVKALENEINKIEDAEKNVSGAENKNAINKANIDKVPTSINYDSLNSEVKQNLKAAYNLNNDDEAKQYFDNRKMEFGINKYNNKLGILITEVDNEDKEEKQYFIYNDEPSINTVAETQQKDKKAIDKSNKSKEDDSRPEQSDVNNEAFEDTDLELEFEEDK